MMRLSLFNPRNDLASNGTVGISGIQQIKIVRGDPHGEFVRRKDHASSFFRIELQMLLEFLELGDAIFLLPMPTVPFFRSCIGPAPWSVRDKSAISLHEIFFIFDFW